MWPTLPPGLRGSRPTNSNLTFDFMATGSLPDVGSALAWFDWEQSMSREKASRQRINWIDWIDGDRMMRLRFFPGLTPQFSRRAGHRACAPGETAIGRP